MKLENNSVFLNAKDLKSGDMVTFTDEGKYETSPFKDKNGNPKRVMKIGVRLADGTLKIANVNKASQTWLGANLGEETKQWIGKSVPVVVVPQNISGKWHKVVYFGELPESGPTSSDEVSPPHDGDMDVEDVTVD